MKLFITELAGAIGQLLLFTLIPFIVWLIAAGKKENFFRWIGLKKAACTSSTVRVIVISLIAIGAYIGLTSVSMKFLPDGITTAGSSLAGKGATAIPAAIASSFIRTALSEEIVFRGFILKRVASKFGFSAGNFVQALCFGLIHGIPFGLVTGNILVTILLTLLPGAMGWFMGWLNEKNFQGSILPSWLIHGFINLTVTLLNI